MKECLFNVPHRRSHFLSQSLLIEHLGCKCLFMINSTDVTSLCYNGNSEKNAAGTEMPVESAIRRRERVGVKMTNLWAYALFLEAILSDFLLSC